MAEPNYNDELVIYEYGKYSYDDYKEWYNIWCNWIEKDKM